MASTIDFVNCPMCGYVNCQRECDVNTGEVWETCSECQYYGKYGTTDPEKEEREVNTNILNPMWDEQIKKCMATGKGWICQRCGSTNNICTKISFIDPRKGNTVEMLCDSCLELSYKEDDEYNKHIEGEKNE